MTPDGIINASATSPVVVLLNDPRIAKSLFMDRTERILAALKKRSYSPVLRERIERLLDGHEDRARMRCCNSGCFVCVQELRAIVAEIEAGDAPTSTP